MTRLTDTLYLLYSYQQDDVDNLARKITERMKATWINQLADLAKLHGCTQFPQPPKGVDARELERMARQDAQTIANTYNRDLRSQINKLFAANPRGNRQYYYSNLEKWSQKRDTWKVYQISLETDSKARQYALVRFYQQNAQLARRFVADGPPPTCEKCIRIFAAGVVDFAFVQRRPLPAHIGCPHLYKAITPVKLSCSKMWLG